MSPLKNNCNNTCRATNASMGYVKNMVRASNPRAALASMVSTAKLLRTSPCVSSRNPKYPDIPSIKHKIALVDKLIQVTRAHRELVKLDRDPATMNAEC
mmetsp:Transcript_7089/g.13117  ORF Transcript_7089/g.13117 Transcript_7089/m.13117 type:complete len:99 (-) Transcript_7089:531-827(-)